MRIFADEFALDQMEETDYFQGQGKSISHSFARSFITTPC